MDSMPFNMFYARTTPELIMQYKDLNKLDDQYVDFDGENFKTELERFFLEPDKLYTTLTEEDLNNELYPENLREFFPSLQTSNYYDSILEMIGIFVKEIVAVPVTQEILEQEIELLYQHYNAIGIPLRNIGFNTIFNADDQQGLKYYRYSIYAYNGQKKELISKSEDIYSSELVWQYRGFLSGTTYNIEVTVID